MLDQIVGIAVTEDVDAVVLAGDNFDSIKPSAEAVERLQAMVASLKAAGIRVIGIAGNHDAVENEWLLVCGIESCAGTVVEIEGVRIYGKHYRRPTVFMEELEADADTVKCDIYVMHQAVKELCGFGGEDLSAERIAPFMSKMGVKYVAMGDIHQYAAGLYGGVWFSYPGSPERCSADDLGLKSVNLISVGADAKVTLGTVAVTPRQFIRINIDTEDTLDTLTAELGAAANARPVVLLTYAPEHKALAQRAEGLLRSMDAIYRMYPLTTALTTEAIELAVNDFTRTNTIDLLRKAVLDYFEATTDEFQLIFQMLAVPETDKLVREYIAKVKQPCA